MTALFECFECNHAWKSVRSLKLPEDCEKCGLEAPNPKLFRKATHQEQLFAKKVS